MSHKLIYSFFKDINLTISVPFREVNQEPGGFALDWCQFLFVIQAPTKCCSRQKWSKVVKSGPKMIFFRLQT